MNPTWKRIWKSLLSVSGWWVLGIITLILVLHFYTLPWTGFGDYTTPSGEFVRGKTLWDWMQLLIIPLFLAAGAIAVNRSEKEIERQRTEERAKIEIQRTEDRAKLEREIATDRQQEAALQAYLDRMTELLLESKLLTTNESEVRDVARIRTLTVLRGLDAKRKGLVIKFLHEANLIKLPKPIINLDGADLEGAYLHSINLQDVSLQRAILKSASLQYAGLEGADLQNANLQYADFACAELMGAKLQHAKMQNTILSKTDLRHADLTGVNLQRANLQSAVLGEVSLIGANLQGANLTGAFLQRANLQGAKIKDTDLYDANLEGATMPDGTKHD